jgi:hypothetical protein
MTMVLASKELAAGTAPEFVREREEVKLVRILFSHELYMYHPSI